MQPRSILKISELNAEVALLLQSAFPLLWVEGEISNLSRPSSGHLYFSLKDSKAQIRCAMFKNKNINLNIKPNNGLKVLARVRVSLYEPRGDYQLIIEHLEDFGEGQLQKDFELLKKKLDTQGLFDSSHKKSLPHFPSRIGIITSATGAALQDVLNVLSRRCPHIPILIYPTPVQGDNAATRIVKAIQQADHDKRCDVLLLIRGGGSIEDLWSFNEEIVANAIFATTIPIVCGVGHEIDFTISDFVSDQRAPTPSAAAELISPNRLDLLSHINHLEKTLINNIKSSFQLKKERLDGLQHRLKQQSGLTILQQYQQQVDRYETRLKHSIQRNNEQLKIKLQHLEKRLLTQSPSHHLGQQHLQINNLKQRLITAIHRKHQHSTDQLNMLATKLNIISPLATLNRGYSIVRDKKTVIYSVQQLSSDKKLNIIVSDGNFNCEVINWVKE